MLANAQGDAIFKRPEFYETLGDLEKAIKIAAYKRLDDKQYAQGCPSETNRAGRK
jgi:hypothetical protein